jgi:single-stranded-DNA-specific exonuclease
VDVAFYPQINDFRGVRTIQLQVVDLCLAPSRAQLEQAIYDKYRQGEHLTQEEVRFLLPSRGDFVGLYRWLVRQSTGCTVVEDTPARIARAVSRATRQREIPARTMLCLEVLEERGLINMNRRVDRIQITLCQVEHKVDLEASEIIKRLRRVLEEL